MLTVFTLCTSFLICRMIIPLLIAVAMQRNIYDEPGERKLHTGKTPLLGGIAIFAGTLISFLFFTTSYFETHHAYMLVSLLILFLTGFIDDLRPLSPVSKLFMQIVAVFISVVFAGIHLRGLHGLFGIYFLDPGYSVALSVLFMLLIINAFNFIDGIDGLAASLGIVSSLVFAILFLSMDEMLFSLFAFSLSGALFAFLLFNFSPARIFMGDTGSMVIGFILALMAVQFTELSRGLTCTTWFSYRSAPVIALTLLIVPAVDFLRVTFIRTINGRSPFHADQNHIHHALVRLGMDHSRTTIILVSVTILFVVMSYLFRNSNQSVVFFGFLLAGILLSQLPFIMLRIKANRVHR